MMLCAKILQRNCNPSVSFILRAEYSRRSQKNSSSYKVVKSNNEPLEDVENTVFGANPNWELLAPRGFRFYLPGSVGPGWLDASTTAQVETRSIVLDDENSIENLMQATNSRPQSQNLEKPVNRQPDVELLDASRAVLHCTVQKCPILLRKGITELFPGCMEVNSPQLTIVTISQKPNAKTMKWSKEIETEKLAKYFLLAASDICTKLKMVGYWADFINPFSGQPYLNPHKSGTLYETDERFRCLGFKIAQKNSCKVISIDSDQTNFVGSLYTTAPPSTEFLQEIVNDLNEQ
ncbi:methylmalonic aciduria and homocystinuria type D homolog, mitochondrial isoform X2 [Athalia rosae]|uniref:methylmalonic aciduria and homocystinuria type D homolog, mitochondrial isoform X2 n=1 Tax=Athalia rosae TaxID=37344 RepID=UPI002033C242|nr:methylmalonic aciduria and homocystinuria type D homolog, mitochondrial isoform X2 [Athalia rosae]